jgi:hypothetical protein
MATALNPFTGELESSGITASSLSLGALSPAQHKQNVISKIVGIGLVIFLIIPPPSPASGRKE